jgi:hypothetical protein
MSDQRSPSDPGPTSTTTGPNPYVFEHYGFAATSDEREQGIANHLPTSAAPPTSADPARPPARARGRKVLAASVVGLVLAGGIGGVATAATVDIGAGHHRGGDGPGVLTVDVRDATGRHDDGQGGRR